MTYDEVMAAEPEIKKHSGTRTSVQYAELFEPGSREVIIWYGRIPGYRSPQSWGFAISDTSATDMWYGHYTSARRSARRIFTHLRQNAEERGFTVRLEVAEGCGLSVEDIQPNPA